MATDPSISAILDDLGELLPLIAVDVGARNGPVELAGLKELTAVYGFEPSAREFEKLSSKTEEILQEKPRQGTQRTFPVALAGTDGYAKLNISVRPGATSTLWPNRELLRHFDADNWSELHQIIDTVTVPAMKLASFAHAAGVDYIDFLKLDTQGNELDILRSAGNLLDRIGVIKTEVEFLPVYEGQPLFSDVAKFLIDQGFEFVDFEISPSCRRFHRFPRLHPRGYRLVWADMILVRKPYDASEPRSIVKALVLSALGYADFAAYIISNAVPDDAALQDRLTAAALQLAKPRTQQGRLREFLERRLGVLIGRYHWKKGHQVVKTTNA